MKPISTGAMSALAVAALLAACGSNVKLNEPPVESRTPTALTTGTAAQPVAPTQGASPGGTSQSTVKTVDLVKPVAAAPTDLKRIVYFDFDSYVIKDEFKPLIEGHARQLAGNKGRRLTIEGHADERGGREYNLALGQKRAEAVVKSLALLGAADGQMEAVSYGEERPAAQGSNEEAWAKNRRAELKDR